MGEQRGRAALLGVGAALAVGTVTGVAVGYIGHALLAEPEVVVPPPEIIEKEITDEDLERLCQALTEDEKTRVLRAQERVRQLEAELEEKERLLAEYREKAKKDEKRRAEARKRYKELEAEVARLRVELAEARRERDELRVELKKTLRELDRQIAETERQRKRAERYRQESTANLWLAFVNHAKVEICDRGTRKRHQRCHEAVDAALDDEVRRRFTECVDTYQAVPVLGKAKKRRDDLLPAFAEWLPEDNRFTRKGWYILFCDPTLPEARDVEGDEPASPRPVDQLGEDGVPPGGDQPRGDANP